MTTPVAQPSPTTASPSPSPVVFTSTTHRYSLRLPPGWSALPQDADGGIQEFGGPEFTDKLRVVVRSPEEAGSTLPGVVPYLGRQLGSTCAAPKQEQTQLDSEPGLFFTFPCPNGFFFATAALHRGRVYLLLMDAAARAEEAQLAAMYRELVEGFSFTD